MHCFVPPEELIALYTVSDICFVSSIRDGMNLVAYEYNAVQKDRHGVLLLSDSPVQLRTYRVACCAIRGMLAGWQTPSMMLLRWISSKEQSTVKSEGNSLCETRGRVFYSRALMWLCTNG
jgi:hypothetical protein